MEILGFRPEYHCCCRCGRTLDEAQAPEGKMLFETPAGILCSSCSPGGPGHEEVSLQAIRALQFLQDAREPDRVQHLILQPELEAEVRMVLRRTLQRHVEGLGALNSEQVFSQMQ